MHDRQFVFAPFRLDPVSQRLWRGEELVPLRPKLFAVLHRLVERAGRLVTREELRAEVWPRAAVSESVLRGTIRELRDALGDDATAARFIETLPHRGYRFVAPVTTRHPPRAELLSGPQGPSRTAPRRGDGILIGRDAELARMHEWLQRAARGVRQVVFVTGEPGIGKTTVVDGFLAAVDGVDEAWTARGQCVEHYGSGEAYLPVLEALGQLCRRPGGEEVIALLSRHAPTWLAQMPGLIGDAELETVQRRVQGATRERMLRELAEALEALTAEKTLVLVLEDLHWSDYSTLDLVSMLAQRRTPARLLLLATYRPADVIVSGHPLHGIKQELRVHEQCEELPLRFLTGLEVGEYLAARFPQQRLPADLGAAIHRSTEGNPLFMVNVVDYWLSQQVLVEVAGQWRLAARVGDIAAGVPESLRQMIEKQLVRLGPDEYRLLEVGSVAGVEFSTAVVADALGENAERVEERCEGLARRGQFLRARGTEVLADGIVTGRYGFLHGLYQQVLYERVAPARRVRLHRRIGEWEETAYGPRVGDAAAELAMHFERGHDAERALRHLAHAGENALRRSAHPEAINLLGKALDLLMTLPETPERAAQELGLQTMLGAALGVTRGYAAPEVEHAHLRAFQLCQQMGETPQCFPVLAGLWGFRFLRAEVHTAGQLAAQLFRVAQSARDSALLLWAHTLQGLTLSMRGELSAGLRHLEEGIALYDPHLHGPERTQVGAQDPKVTCLSYAAWTLWRLGYPDQARKRIDETLAWAQELSHPFSSAFGLGFAAAGVGMFLRDAPGVQAHAETLMKMCHEQGFPYWLGWGRVWQGGALAAQGRPEAGIAAMREGMATLQHTGAKLGRSYILAQVAEAHGTLGQANEGLALLAQALALVESTGERWYEAELHRLQGELLLQTERQPRSRRGGKKTGRIAGELEDSVEACFRTAIEIARRQQARSLELRAATSLSRLWQRQGKRRQAHEMLSAIYGWFTEGLDTPDLCDAHALLAELA
jgi:DNA-binding winged helix-turn-helix (wHTH) protein/predicted ATPase